MPTPRFTFEQLCDAEDRAQAMRDPHQQLRLAVQQAEGYRTFLSSLTGLLAAVFVLKGQEDLSKLSDCPRRTVIILLIGGFLGLITATWLTVLATHDRPGVEVYSEPNRLLQYEKRRTRTVWALVEASRWLGLLSVLAVATAVIVTWLAPGK
ncbi:hypothetical protein PV729_17635 [Streptomyces europaeiscabiei]|uniref:Uncharacterized protein n=1 Tax=Streptomyces europaeiscabiei TaxID=146819 RepID=A0ABU4NEK9_9ACTN|nr:hypothetical protein [Streptomyces europaeiscabiei]MDX3543597.1 hypothetical protein [Streptomyces europaeiscabiei]MDX3553566.1 hypothetical protein [Streptomyces europaeiscabiei]MDX3689060.1 hypothetical protein [Streptomyces europaeiscabiei]MDX3701530.1 hypothetical protein [Streptomyces europaeiscabiei]